MSDERQVFAHSALALDEIAQHRGEKGTGTP